MYDMGDGYANVKIDIPLGISPTKRTTLSSKTKEFKGKCLMILNTEHNTKSEEGKKT